jgi:hypothetical protein
MPQVVLDLSMLDNDNAIVNVSNLIVLHLATLMHKIKVCHQSPWLGEGMCWPMRISPPVFEFYIGYSRLQSRRAVENRDVAGPGERR